LNHEEHQTLIEAAKIIPIVFAPNMSVGVNLTFALAKTATSILKENFDIEIVEKHHRHKKDSPSGTAIRLAEVIAQTKGKELSQIWKHGREGEVGARTRDEIGMHAVRGGDFVGEHTVIYAGDGEVIEITHKASSRDIFAKGALRAAKWVSTVTPGLYSMQDVLGLSTS
jgi:4-hydroxy-tetrahydrodipicolinate reductase